MVTAAEVSAALKVAVKTLSNWRGQGKGPAWSKVGGRVRYQWADVTAYIAARRQEAAA
jgi:predicted site-specific integrase-resolvase